MAPFTPINFSNPSEVAEYLNIVKLLPDSASATSWLPPWLTDKDYVPPNKSGPLFIIAILSMAIAFLVVMLRLFTRLKYNRGRLTADDWMMIPATIVTVGFTFIQCWSVKRSQLGMHVYDIKVSSMQMGLELTYAHQILYTTSIVLIKLSIILFIHRLSIANKTMQTVCKIYFIIHVLWGVGCILGLALQCHPIAAGFDLYAKLHSHCSSVITYYTLSSFNVVSDVAILALPMKLIWSLTIPKRQKIGGMILFGLGGVACIATILRMRYLFIGLKGADYSWDIVNVAVFGQLEATLSMIATSVPSTKLFFTKLFVSKETAKGSFFSEESGGLYVQGGGSDQAIRNISKFGISSPLSEAELPDLEMAMGPSVKEKLSVPVRLKSLAKGHWRSDTMQSAESLYSEPAPLPEKNLPKVIVRG